MARAQQRKVWQRHCIAEYGQYRKLDVQKINQTKSTHGEGFSLPNTQEKTMGILIAVFGLGIVLGTVSGIILTSPAKASKDEGRKDSE